MELKRFCVLIVIFAVFFKIAFVLGIQTAVSGNFYISQKHPGVKNSAAAVLDKNDLVGGRVSTVTGMCEGLQYDWALHQTKESGYAYLIKIRVQESYHPAINLAIQQGIYWQIPGVLGPGAKVEITVTRPMDCVYAIILIDTLATVEDGLIIEKIPDDWHYIHFSSFRHRTFIGERLWGKGINNRTEGPPITNVEEKISFHVQTDMIEILAAGKKLLKYSRKDLHLLLKTMRQVIVQKTSGESACTLHSFEYTDA